MVRNRRRARTPIGCRTVGCSGEASGSAASIILLNGMTVPPTMLAAAMESSDCQAMTHLSSWQSIEDRIQSLVPGDSRPSCEQPSLRRRLASLPAHPAEPTPEPGRRGAVRGRPFHRNVAFGGSPCGSPCRRASSIFRLSSPRDMAQRWLAAKIGLRIGEKSFSSGFSAVMRQS